MIVVLRPDATDTQRARIEHRLREHGVEPRPAESVGAPGAVALVAAGADPACVSDLPGVAAVYRVPSRHPLASRPGSRTVVHIGPATVGDGSIQIIAGPCAVESPEQIEQIAAACARAHVTVLRGGAFKPRTSPYSFRGVGHEALAWMRAAADRHGLAVVTEALDTAHLGTVAEHADLVQIGSRNMQNFALLAAAGRCGRAVLLKRSASATLEEWLLAAEYLLDAGCASVILCERGVRGFDPSARHLLDVAAVPLLRLRTHLPVAVDPSHGVGVRAAVLPMACAAAAAGADAVMIEVHPDPGAARSDGFQALPLGQLESLARRVHAVARAARVAEP